MASLDVDVAASALTPLLIHLIENAAASFEADRSAAREYLFHAYDLIRAQVKHPRASTADCARGRLAIWQVRRVITYIDDNLGTTLQTKDLANLVNLSLSHFFRAFKISVGISPREYVTRRRIELARKMMATTDEPLAQIALACGLNDQSSFCRVFRQVVGQTPSEWRRLSATGPRPGTVDRPRASVSTHMAR